MIRWEQVMTIMPMTGTLPVVLGVDRRDKVTSGECGRKEAPFKDTRNTTPQRYRQSVPPPYLSLQAGASRLQYISHPLIGAAEISHPLNGAADISHPLNGAADFSHPLNGAADISHPLNGAADFSHPLIGAADISHPLNGSGILSWDPLENPYYFHSNVVYVPYCSSDSWSGTRPRTSAMDFSFMGSRILDEVFDELLKKGLKQAKTVIVAGTSAGGTGVLINIDRIADIIHASDPSIDVRGLVDAGWFLDNEPFRVKHCRDAFTCSPMAGIQRGAQVWAPRLPEACTSAYPNEIWRCFFGHRVFTSIKSSIYVIQNLYDAAQIKVNNVFDDRPRSDLTSEQWRYLLSLGEEVKQSLQNVSAVFAPACVTHEILTQPEWHTIRIQGTSLAESIHCWESGAVTPSCLQPNLDSMLPKSDAPLSDAPPNGQNKRRKRKKGKKNKQKNKNKISLKLVPSLLGQEIGQEIPNAGIISAP
ncbi:Palmitoleoyl-protein carboxylesterase notum1 [Bulinus truncatus]|nr:Palmitoleoyl-protein carboxylesterase notum1 [Bulinus truncatus]